MIELRTPAEIEAMRPAGLFVASVLVAVREATTVGTNLLELDAIAHQMIRDAGAESCYIDYHPSFGGSPFGKVSIDFAASIDGWVCDSAISFVAGTADPEDLRVINATEEALVAGIAAATVGNAIGDISAAIGDVADSYGYGVNLDFGGHGVGREMHGDPHVPNDGRPGRGYKLREGLVIAIEPWFMRDTDEIFTDADGWTLRSADGSRGAHSEHTIAITAEGPVVLTSRHG